MIDISGSSATTLPLARSAGTSSTVLNPAFGIATLPWHELQYVVSVASAFCGAVAQASCAGGSLLAGGSFAGGLFAGGLVGLLGLVVSACSGGSSSGLLLPGSFAPEPADAAGSEPASFAGSCLIGDSGPSPTNASQPAKQSVARSMGAIVYV